MLHTSSSRHRLFLDLLLWCVLIAGFCVISAVRATGCDPLDARIDIEDSEALNGQPVTIAVTTSDTTVLTPQAFSADFHISYDASVLSTGPGPFFGVALGPVGASNGSTLTVLHQAPGSLFISLFSDQPYEGEGDLVTITFPIVTGAPGTFSPIVFTPFLNHPLGFLYNEGFPTVCVMNGSVSIRGQLSGNVYYRPVSPVWPRNVPDTTLTSTGGAPNPAPVLTDAMGNYTIYGFGPYGYTLTPSRSGSSLPDTHGTSISAYDASITAQFVVQLIILSTEQQFVANVTGSVPIISNDSAFMARWAVGLPNTIYTGDWRFSPSSRTYASVTNQTNQDYRAFLMGDVTGNWCDPTSIPVLPCNANGTVIGEQRSVGGPERATAVRVQNVVAPAGTDVVVPVNVSGAANKGITAYQFDLRYDPSVIQPTADAVTLAGTVSDGYSVVFNPYQPGLLRVAVYGVMPLSDAGTLFKFRFTAVGDPLRVSPLTIENFMFNEGGIRTNVVNGQVEISTAAANTTARDN